MNSVIQTIFLLGLRTQSVNCKRVIFMACFLAGIAGAHELKDITLTSSSGQIKLGVAFSGTATESEFPEFFQKADSATRTITLSFLETETAFPLGKQTLDSGTPAIDDLQFRKMTSPSGKVFLGIELKIKDASLLEAALQPGSKGSLKIEIGKGAKKKINWSLAKSIKAREDYLAAKAAAPPMPVVPSTGVKSAAPSSQAETDSLKTESLAKATAKEKLEAAKTVTPSGEPAKPAVTKPIAAEQAVAPQVESSASVSKTEEKAKQIEPPVGVKSAHEEGAALEIAHTQKKLSSSKIFSVGRGKKTMILVKDSVSLTDGPDTEKGKGNILKKILVGESVERLEVKSGWAKVLVGKDTGYIKTSNAVYADEITEAQEKGIQNKIAAKAVKLAAAEAKAQAKLKADEAKAVAQALALQKQEEAKLAKLAAAAALVAAKKQKADSLALVAASKKEKADSIALAKKIASAPVNAPAQVVSAPAAKTPLPSAKDSVINLTATKNKGGQSTPPPKLAIADNPELAAKLAKEKRTAEDEKMRVEPEENRVSYNSYGRRDPFIPVEQGAVDNGIDIDQMKVVGIIWQASEPMAVLEHTHEANVSFTIKQGDPVHNGKVARITREGVTFDITEYGISRSYSLKLVSSKEGTKK